MLSSVLRSSAAIAVNIEIMRAFVVLELSKRVDSHDVAIRDLIETIRRLVETPPPKKRSIGFVPIE